MRRLGLVLVSSCMVAIAAAQPPELVIEDLGSAPQVLNPNYFGLDLHMATLGGGTGWTAAALFAETYAGASFVYAADPNGQIAVTVPDRDGVPLSDAERYVTFVSRPRGQMAPQRFRASGAPEVAGKYLGGTGPPTVNADAFDIAYFRDPFSVEPNPGYIARLMFDVGAVNPALGLASVYAIPGTNPVLAEDRLLATGIATALTDAHVDADLCQIQFSVFASGDCNQNGVPDHLESPTDCEPDCNQDGLPDTSFESCNCAADFDDNGVIDITDVAIAAIYYGRTSADPLRGDTNGDGRVDLTDIAEVIRSFACCCE